MKFGQIRNLRLLLNKKNLTITRTRKEANAYWVRSHFMGGGHGYVRKTQKLYVNYRSRDIENSCRADVNKSGLYLVLTRNMKHGSIG